MAVRGGLSFVAPMVETRSLPRTLKTQDMGMGDERSLNELRRKKKLG